MAHNLNTRSTAADAVHASFRLSGGFAGFIDWMVSVCSSRAQALIVIYGWHRAKHARLSASEARSYTLTKVVTSAHSKRATVFYSCHSKATTLVVAFVAQVWTCLLARPVAARDSCEAVRRLPFGRTNAPWSTAGQRSTGGDVRAGVGCCELLCLLCIHRLLYP